MPHAVYILSSPGNPLGYKIGFTTQNQNELRAQYTRAIPNCVIHLFYPHPNAKIIEHTIHRANKPVHGEWYNISLYEAINLVMLHMKPEAPTLDWLERDNACTVAANRDNLAKLQAFKTAGALWDANKVATAAILGGHLECLKFAEQNGLLNDNMLKIAYKNDHECFKYLWSKSPNVDLSTYDGLPENIAFLRGSVTR